MTTDTRIIAPKCAGCGHRIADVVVPGVVLTCTRSKCKTVNRW